MEREVAQVRAMQRKLGDAVGWIVDTLLLDEGDVKDNPGKKTLHKRKQEALESLAYVRDILKGTVSDIEEDRLVGEEEVKRRREKERKEKEAAEALSRKASTPHPPMPAAAVPIEARPQGSGARRSHDYFLPHSSGSSPPTPRTIPPGPAPASQAQTVRAAASPFPPSLASVSIPVSASAPSAKSPISSGSTFHAPWHYTKSAFSSADSPIATLPRVPPRTSTVLPLPALPRAQPLPPSFRARSPQAPTGATSEPVSRDQKPKQAPYDPLGAIP